MSHNRNNKKWPRTQDLDKIYEVNSAAFIALRSVYIKDKDRLDTKPLAIEIKKNKSLDIDNITDLMQFKKILKND